ncbi:MAG: GNAT family N-acetyltransferase [Patescibacteria group bacterium]
MSAEFIPPSPSNWEIFGNQIYKIERNIFGEKSLDEKMMESDINSPEANLVLLKDGDAVVGFTYALPESEGVARIVDTVIAKEYQKKGLVAILMSSLEAELKRKGYEYVTRDAMVDNGYAGKIAKNYSSGIVETREFMGEWGKQRYFKIKL